MSRSVYKHLRQHTISRWRPGAVLAPGAHRRSQPHQEVETLDADHFDTLTRTLTRGAPSRRAVLRGLAAATGLSLSCRSGVGAKRQEKVTVCHKGRLIEVAAAAGQAHVDHGDTVGFCACAPNCIRFVTTEGQSVCVLELSRGPFQSCSSSGECPDDFPTCATLVEDTAGDRCTLYVHLC